MPPKKKSQNRPSRTEQSEKEKKKPTTNLRDLLNRSNSTLKQRSGIEKDGDFIFKRTSSQLESESSKTSNSKSNNSGKSKKPKLDKNNIRKLTSKDVTITPEINRVNDRYEEHSTSVQLALPISDSPIIRRNKEIRNDSSRNRRSSLGNRGKRVSSIGNGFDGVPHERIPTTEYHKHLDSDLPDPHKMRQLLIWCSKKKFDEDKNKHIKQKNKLSSEDLTALNIAKVIKEEVVRDLVDGKINVSWWNREDDTEENASSSQQQVKIIPNERNTKNQQVLKDLETRLVSLKAKTAEWEENLSKPIKIHTSNASHSKFKSQLKGDEKFAKVLDNSILDEISSLQDSTLNDISENLELDIDTFNDVVHKLKSASSVRSKFTLLKSKKLTEILDTTFSDETLDKIQQSDTNKNIDTEQLLRGISKLDR
jgi:kinetochore protein Mis13/DSN1